MTTGKRLFDIGLAVTLALLLMPFLLVLLLAIRVLDGRPLFYVSERMKAPGVAFQLWKLRTMTTGVQDSGVSGGDKAGRITRVGRILRKSRLDEIPQLWNIMKGDMSFVGPRPPLRIYVEQFPEIYGKVLQSRPGITGLATLIYHTHEEAILKPCQTAAQTNETYVRRCIPAKARLDIIYQKHRTMCFDCALLLKTAAKLLPLGRF